MKHLWLPARSGLGLIELLVGLSITVVVLYGGSLFFKSLSSDAAGLNLRNTAEIELSQLVRQLRKSYDERKGTPVVLSGSPCPGLELTEPLLSGGDFKLTYQTTCEQAPNIGTEFSSLWIGTDVQCQPNQRPVILFKTLTTTSTIEQRFPKTAEPLAAALCVSVSAQETTLNVGYSYRKTNTTYTISENIFLPLSAKAPSITYLPPEPP